MRELGTVGGFEQFQGEDGTDLGAVQFVAAILMVMEMCGFPAPG